MTFMGLIVLLLLVSAIFGKFWEVVKAGITIMLAVIVFFIFLGTVA